MTASPILPIGIFSELKRELNGQGSLTGGAMPMRQT
jgi:hypothetical protein